MEIKRIVDILPYQLKHFSQEDAFASKEQGSWKKYSTRDAIDLSDKVSLALLASGIQPGDKVAIVANNRPEWNFVDFGILQVRCINVPLYPTISPADYKFILNDAEVKLIFVSDKDLFDKVSSVRPEVPALKEIYTFNRVPGAKHWTEFLALADAGRIQEVRKLSDSIREEELATIIYTSGTTGVPKGVMLSHRNIISNVVACTPLLPVDHRHRAFSFLPLNHVFERMVTYLYMSQGISIYYAESMDTIGDNLREVCPHIFTAVPRLIEKVYDKIVSKGSELTGLKKKLFNWSIRLGLEYDYRGKSPWYHFQLAIANMLVFSKWRKALGGNIRALVSGSSALQPRLARTFTAAKIPVLEGYGLTETSPVISVNRVEKKDAMFATVGMVIDGVQVSIAEDGEILCKGPNIMMGYYKRPDLTAEVIDKDGWFHTGDVGTFVDGRFLKITDRKKEMFKTSGGKYVAPLQIETKFKESPYIEQIMVVGEYRKFVSALIVPAFPHLEQWCRENNVEFAGKAGVIRHPKVLALYQQIADSFNPGFGHVEQVKMMLLVPDEWSVPTGEMTPNMKLKRKVILEKYKNEIEEIYK